MATIAGNSEGSSALDTVSLRVFSQLPEPNSTILFTSLPLSTTVEGLKGQIRDRVDTKPPTTDQRLIYRGRLLMKDTDTLRQVFGAEDVKSNQPLTLHLVVRDRSVNPTSGQAAPAPNQQPPPNPPARVDTTRRQQTATGNVQNTTQTRGQQGPNPIIHPGLASQRPLGSTNGQHNHTHGQMPQMLPQGAQFMHNMFPTPAFPSPMPPGVTIIHTPQGPRFVTPDGQMHGPPPPPFPPLPHLNAQHMAQNFPLMHPAGHPMNMPLHQGMHPPQHAAQATNGSEPQTLTSSSTTEQGHAQPGTDQNHRNLVRREGVGPNGERWVMTVNSNFPVPAAIHNVPPPRPGQYNTQHESNSGDARNSISTITIQQNYELFLALECLIRARDQVYAIERHYVEEMNSIRIRSPSFVAEHIGGNIAATCETRNRAQAIVNQTIQTGAPGVETLQALGVTIEILVSLEREFLQVTNRLIQTLRSFVRFSNPELPDGVPPPPPPPPGEIRPYVAGYLLSSPSGPQSLVFSSEGVFVPATNSQRSNTSQNPALSRIFNQMDQAMLQNSRVMEEMERAMTTARRGNQRDRRQNGAPNAHEHAGNAQFNQARQEVVGDDPNRAALQAGHQPPQNQNGNIDLGILVPILRALWILVRVAGFIWFFSSGSMTRRSWLLCLSAIIVFAAQAAMVRTQLDRVRQYFEDILAGPDAQRQEGQNDAARDQQRDQNADQNQAPNDETAQARRRRQPNPTPEATAERLLREARQTQQGRLQEMLRAIERAVVLFVGSLYPGVGERQIQARERLLREQEQREAQAALPAPTEENANAQASSGGDAGTNQQETSASASANASASSPSGGDNATNSAAPAQEDAGVGSSTSADPTAGSTGEIRQRQVDGASSS